MMKLERSTGEIVEGWFARLVNVPTKGERLMADL